MHTQTFTKAIFVGIDIIHTRTHAHTNIVYIITQRLAQKHMGTNLLTVLRSAKVVKELKVKVQSLRIILIPQSSSIQGQIAAQ